MPLLSLVQELLSHSETGCSEKLGLIENRYVLYSNAYSDSYSEDVERSASNMIVCSIKSELHQLLPEDIYTEFINNYQNIPSNIALEIERKVTPRIVDGLKHLNISDYRKEILVRKCMRQILTED